MMLLLSGEGPTDLGSCTMGLPTCENEAGFEIGPLTVLIDQVIEQKLSYSLRSIPKSICYIGKQELKVEAKAARGRMNPFRGLKAVAETNEFAIPARTLGKIADKLEKENQVPVVAVLFHDTDGTNTSSNLRWEIKFESINNGFKSASFTKGVAMIPKPKSEAWLLCAIQQPPYQHCAALENLPGNDDSPNSAKSKLEDAFGRNATRQSLVEWLEEHGFQHDAVAEQMPSYEEFLTQLRRAIDIAKQPLQANPS